MITRILKQLTIIINYLQTVVRNQTTIMTNLDRLTNDVTNEETGIQSLITSQTAIHTDIAKALELLQQGDQQAAVDLLANTLEAGQASLATVKSSLDADDAALQAQDGTGTPAAPAGSAAPVAGAGSNPNPTQGSAPSVPNGGTPSSPAAGTTNEPTTK